MRRRGSGILLHITSLPSPYGIGDLGPEAYAFADFLSEARQSYWQILPLSRTDVGHGNSPYSSQCAFSANPLLISPELLRDDGLLTVEDLRDVTDFPPGRVDYGKVADYKSGLFDRAYERFKERGDREAYERFCSENSDWLDDSTLFIALKAHFGEKAWSEWPPEVRDRDPAALDSLKKLLFESVEREKFLQYIFLRQWFTLKRLLNEKGIQVIGDMPIYVNYDSADVWADPALFKLDEGKKPRFVSGVPPDYFSATGQLWGNPVYDWEALKETGYRWWMQRFSHTLRLFDVVRVDHFRGFVAYWEVPAGDATAERGRWVEAPAEGLFGTLLRHLPCLSIIAEDLGTITPDVREVMDLFEFPGMKVLLFAFGEDNPIHPYLPHTYEKNCVVYTGTHDNNTVRGWLEKETSPEDKERLFQYLGRAVPIGELNREMMRLAMGSVADTAILPLQDVLGLGETARMNRPAGGEGNWQWRLVEGQLTSEAVKRLRVMTETYGRA